MLAKPVWSQIVDDEALTRGLGDPEARMLVEWLVERAEGLADDGVPTEEIEAIVQGWCRRMRAVVRFVRLWCHEGARAAAIQLAAVERFAWPLPTTGLDPCELMQQVLHGELEAAHRAASAG
jgi:hypothetical protein